MTSGFTLEYIFRNTAKSLFKPIALFFLMSIVFRHEVNLFREHRGISCCSFSFILSDFWEKKGKAFPAHPHPQHLADGLPEHLVRRGLMDWYLDIGTVPVSGVKY
jgi:hypothetical protein